MLKYNPSSLQYEPINNYFDLVNREVQVQEELNNICDIITKLKVKTADLTTNEQLEGNIDSVIEALELTDEKIDKQNKELQEQNKKLVEQLSILKSLTSHLVNRLDEQDKKITSLTCMKLIDWTTSNSFIITIQKVWRGYFVRKTIKMKVLELKKYLSTLCK